ncbi:MAG: hypothetical protein ACYSUI_05575 [Planctomycetota bacterium]|jgi:hypothetical protein
MYTPQARALLAAADPYGIDTAWRETKTDSIVYRPMEHPHFALGRIQWGNYAEADNTGSYFRYRTPKGRRGLGDIGEDYAAAQKDAQEGMETVQTVMKDAKKYGAALKGFIDFFSFGAGPITAPTILTKGCPPNKHTSVKTRENFINAVANGWQATESTGGYDKCPGQNPLAWARFGLKPPHGTKPSEEHIWNPIAGVWQTSPLDMTKDAIKTAVKPTPSYSTATMQQSAPRMANGFAASLPGMFAAMDLLVQAKKWSAVKTELESWVRSVSFPRFVWAADHGTVVTQTGSLYKGQTAKKVMQDLISKAIDVIAVTPTANRPANIGALTVAAGKYGLGAKLPATPQGLPATPTGTGGGAAGAIGLGAALWFLLKFLG